MTSSSFAGSRRACDRDIVSRPFAAFCGGSVGCRRPSGRLRVPPVRGYRLACGLDLKIAWWMSHNRLQWRTAVFGALQEQEGRVTTAAAACLVCEDVRGGWLCSEEARLI